MEVAAGLFDLCKQAAFIFAVYVTTGPIRERYPPLRLPVLAAIFLGAVWMTMESAVPLGGGVVADLRGALLFASMVYGGKLVGFTVLAFAETFRTYLGGGGMLAGLVGNALASAIGLAFLAITTDQQPHTARRLAVLAASAVCIVASTNLAFLFVRPFDLAWATWTQSAFTVSIANFVSVLMICGLLELDRAWRAAHARDRLSSARLTQVVSATGVGIWDWRAQTGEVVVNERWAQMLGYSLAELGPISIETWRRLANPDELRLSDEVLVPVLAGTRQDYSCDVRMRHKDGHWVWIRDSGRAVEWDAKGRAVRMIGTHLDITELRQAYESADAAARRFSAIVQSAPDAILTIGPKREILSFNPEAENLFGYRQAEIVGQPLEVLIPPSDRDSHRAQADSFLVGKDDAVKAMANWRTVMGVASDGRTIPLMITISRTHEDGRPIAVAIARDMTVSNAQQEMLADLNARLERKLIEAESANRAKTRFLAAMSHELRTPLNSIIGFADYLRSDHFGEIPDDKKKEYLGDIAQSGNHLLSLINDLLDLARIEEGRLELQMEPFRIRQTVKQAIRLSKTAIARRSVRIRWLTEPPDLEVQADRRAVLQVVLNLVSNAVKFVPERTGRVRVRTTSTPDGRVCISVEDNGCGIPKDRIHELGHPFVQIGNPLLSETKGAGLGLAICRQLMHQMGGEMTIESELGKWTRVTVVMRKA